VYTFLHSFRFAFSLCFFTYLIFLSCLFLFVSVFYLSSTGLFVPVTFPPFFLYFLSFYPLLSISLVCFRTSCLSSIYILLGTLAYRNLNFVSRGGGEGIASEDFT